MQAGQSSSANMQVCGLCAGNIEVVWRLAEIRTFDRRYYRVHEIARNATQMATDRATGESVSSRGPPYLSCGNAWKYELPAIDQSTSDGR